MRVCMLAYTFYEGDNRVRRYAEALVKRGDTVDIVACGRPEQPSTVIISGVTVYRVQTRRINEKGKLDYLVRIMLFLVKSFVFFTWRHLRDPYHLVHVHSVPDFEVFAAVAARLTGAKIILDIHDIVPEFYAGKFNGGRITRLTRALMIVEKICCRFCDHVIIANHLWEKTIVARSVPQQRCSVMLNYPDPAIFRRDLPRNTDGVFTMMYPGTLSRHQGLDIAISAIGLVKDSLPPFRFDIYGRGSHEQALKDQAAFLGLEQCVIFHGIVALEAVARSMAAASLGIIPKRADDFGNEAFSTKIFEFMALSVPVLIASTKIDRYYFNESVVTFFESGDTCELAEKILFLAGNKGARDAQAKNADAFIRQYSWDVRKNDYFALVDSLTGLKGGQP